MEADDKHHDANQEGDQIPAHDTGQRQNAPDHRQHDAEPKQGTVAKWAKPITDWPVRGFRWLLHMLKTAEGLITALATVGIFIVAWLQWETFEKTDRTLNQTMVNGQRAYLSVQNAGIDPQKKWSLLKPLIGARHQLARRTFGSDGPSGTILAEGSTIVGGLTTSTTAARSGSTTSGRSAVTTRTPHTLRQLRTGEAPSATRGPLARRSVSMGW